MSEKEALKILGNPMFELEKIKNAYHILAMKTHPDKNGNTPEATAAFQKIQAAYEAALKALKGGSKRHIRRIYRKTKKMYRHTKRHRKTQK